MIEMKDVVKQEQRSIDWRLIDRHGLSPRQGAARYYWMNRCPLYPGKRTCAMQLGMSAMGQKRTSEKAVLGIPDDYAARSTRTLISLRSALKSMGLAKSAKISASNEALDRNNPTTPTRPSCNLPT